jgi:hypothetical protein
MQIEPVPARDKRQSFGRIAAELVGGAGLSRVIPRRRQPAANLPPARLEPTDIVSLPAVNRDRHGRERLQSPLDIHTMPGVLITRDVVRALDPSVAHTSLSCVKPTEGAEITEFTTEERSERRRTKSSRCGWRIAGRWPAIK